MSSFRTVRSTVIATLALSAAAHAQGPASSSSVAADTGLEEIVVTANRSAQDVQKVSAAVQVVSGDTISEQGLTSTKQIFAMMPSVQVTSQPAGFNVDIRGQGADLPAGSQQGAAALVLDGAYNITSEAQIVGFFDLDRIEVLPGPQSTRYGPNADGGIVNVYSKDPVLGSNDGRGIFTWGNYALTRGEIAQNVSLGSFGALRIAAAGVYQGSYYEPAEGNNLGESARIKYLYQPSDNFHIKLTYEVNHVGGTGAGSEPQSSAYVPDYPNGAINTPSYACSLSPAKDCASPWNHGPYSDNGIATGNDHASINEQTFIGNVYYAFGNLMAVDFTPSYIRGSGRQNYCNGGFGSPTYGGDWACQLSYPFAPMSETAAELRLHSLPGDKVTWDLGYYHWIYHNYSWTDNPPQDTYQSGGEDQIHTNALFGEATVPVTDKLRVIAGLRGSRDERIIEPKAGNGADATVIGIFTHTWDHVDYRLGQEYDIAPQSMEYFTTATGYRPGILDYNDHVTPGYPFHLPDEVITSYELGFKNRFFDNTLQLNIDGFYYHEHNYQELDFYQVQGITLPNGTVCPNGGPGVSSPPACNANNWEAQAQVWGIELQVQYAPTRDDRVNVTATKLNAIFDKNDTTCATTAAPTTPGCWYGYNPGGGPPQFFNIAGAVQPHSPSFASTVSYVHTFHLWGGNEATLGGDWFHTTGYFVHPNENPDGTAWQPPYSTGNLQVGFKPDSSFWSVNAYVHNVTNYAVKTSYVPYTSIGDPRTYGVTLNVNW